MAMESQDLAALCGQWWDLLALPANARYDGQGRMVIEMYVAAQNQGHCLRLEAHSQILGKSRGQMLTESPSLVCFKGWKQNNSVLVGNVERRYVIS